jgi:hypothetical protein
VTRRAAPLRYGQPSECVICAYPPEQQRLIMLNSALRIALQDRYLKVDLSENSHAVLQVPVVSADDIKRLVDKLDQ